MTVARRNIDIEILKGLRQLKAGRSGRTTHTRKPKTLDHTIPPAVRSDILQRIAQVEKEHSVQVLLAIESGSRAWGFASPNSDYDVRFIYRHQQDWYLSIDLEERRDVIEYPIVDEIDLNGWDVRKAMRLFRKSYPAIVEWIQSPIIYVEKGSFAGSARSALPKVYSTINGIHHYRSMAKRNYRSYFKTELVPQKKYFYVLRPLLAARWIERYGAAPPIEFGKLLVLIKHEKLTIRDIAKLLAEKRRALEVARGSRIAAIDRFIEAELDRVPETPRDTNDHAKATREIDKIFRACLRT
jgi:predicted nucleotidyltransferase